nr:Down syndrome cell adhesion molecule-like protein Dscam2 [Danaus plexippus plexippus]
MNLAFIIYGFLQAVTAVTVTFVGKKAETKSVLTHFKTKRNPLSYPESRISEGSSDRPDYGTLIWTGLTNIRSNEYKKNRKKHTLDDISYEPVSFGLRMKRDLGPRNVMITQHFNNKIVSPGEDVSLQCTATSDKPPRFIWERDGVVISSNTDSRYILGQMMSASGVGVISHLNISRSRVEDGGLYTCVAYEGDSNTRHSSRIDVYGPPYIRTLPPIKVQSGDSLKLRCPFYGFPISKLEWEHRGKKIISTMLPQHARYKRTENRFSDKHNIIERRERQVIETSEDGLLNIQRVVKEENGEMYTCIVYSPSGEMARRSFEIQVVEAPELDELRVGSGLKEGQIVQITCNIIGGDPPIFFSWLKDGMKIPASLKINERSSELFSVLIIKRVSLEHCGRYTCIATNHVGKVNQTTELYINVAPKWVEEPTNKSLLLGHRGVVDCNANGYPEPQIHWMKRDSLGIWRPILDLAGGVSSYPNGSLTLEVVSLSDEGEYACHVDNGVGEALNKNLWISVNKPVHFESLGMNLTTKIGLPIALTCQPLGDSPIRIKWTLDGKPVEFTSSRITISESQTYTGMNSTLSINYVEGRDRGNYECRASNPYGVDSYNIHLNILEPPSPPQDFQVDTVSSSIAKLSFRDTLPHVEYYTLQYTSNQYSLWEAAKTINITRQQAPRQSVQLVGLQPSAEYRARVAAGNKVALSEYTSPVHFTTLQEAPSSSPLSVQVEQTENPGELSVSWIQPSRETHNGALQGYLLKAVPRIGGDSGTNNSQTKLVKVMARKGKQETILTSLLKNTRYAISVSAFNAAGNGPFSLPVYQTTREGAPEEPPSGVECVGASSTSLRVAWRAPSAPHLGHVLLYSSEDGPWLNISTPHSELYIQGLLKYTNYTLKVAAFSSYGVGPYSYPVVCTTLQDVPGAPAAIKALVSSPTSLIVSWKKPDQPNGIITHYTVYVKPVTSTNAPQSYRVDPNQESNLSQLTFSVTGLTTGLQYEVFVRAHTTVGEGSPSNRIHVEVTSRVVAGISSLSSWVSTGVGRSLLLSCPCSGSPPPRTVWYHNHNIITHHPRFTRNHDDSLLINNIDQSLSGNYTCLAKNLYGSDSVSYVVSVLPTPDPPMMRVTPHKNSLYIQWDQPKKINGKNQKITFDLTWKEANGIWQDAWSNKVATIQGVQDFNLEGLKCGTKYSLRMTAANSIGSSQPAYIDASTLGGVPISPTTTEWFWSNATHIYIQLSGWEDNGCEITKWEVDYREYGGKVWRRAENKLPLHPWSHYSSPNTFALSDLTPGRWYQLRVLAENSAGITSAVFMYATTTEMGESIGPPTDYIDFNMIVIICSSIMLFVCLAACLYIIVKRHNHQRLTEYRNSLTVECKSERSNVTVNTPQSIPSEVNNRVYSTPVHLTADNKHELYEISPYAQFALGFRTFGHVENNAAPRPGRYDSETSFQMRSESEDSDCVSRTTTLKSAPRSMLH